VVIRTIVPAAVALVAAALAAGGSPARPPAQPCGSNGPSKGKPTATPVQAAGSGPTTIDQRTTPQLAPGKPPTGPPPELPQPGIERAKKLKRAANPDCVPHAAPTVPGPPRTP
jgi:hypothetical protein